MTRCTVHAGKYEIPVYTLNTLIIGTGAAGFNAADRLYGSGQHDIAIVSEHVGSGTSRNTGSDKQTYYKLTLSGEQGDSVRAMASDLFKGGCIDGDIALCEAALSTQCFMHLVDLGVPFPRNRYGEFIGYKTDHDPRQRATSVGPYTSKVMTECLEKTVRDRHIRIFDGLLVVRIFVYGGKVEGVLCLDVSDTSRVGFVAFDCTNLLYATGGPAGMYADSVYPFSQHGATGIAFEAGVAGRNLTEWQYGIASVKPRWNVSGTYMQVLPRFISTDEHGGDEKEFLSGCFTDKGDMLTRIFLKGYQWPFDVRKIEGSSLIDLLVYQETLRGRRVFLDFRSNPGNVPVDFSLLSAEARAYLEKAGVCFGTPVERLGKMNAPALDFYASRGVDLSRQPLEVALCAQHNNGGLAVDSWWQTNIGHFFAAGEVCATHGIYRPGGSALNAGQVGSLRAAQFIAVRCSEEPLSVGSFMEHNGSSMSEMIELGIAASGDIDTVTDCWNRATARMSHVGAAIRDKEAMQAAIGEIKDELEHFKERVKAPLPKLSKVFSLRDVLLSQYVYLNAMVDYCHNGGKSRGSALYTDDKGMLPYDNLPEKFRFILDDGGLSSQVQETYYENGHCRFRWRPVKPIPPADDFFETVWQRFRKDGNIW
ncbi:MAG: FAD-binding protein [Spirochaetia bacterium]|nr:FAD-binding protein [Spirochaetia bacterium]